MDREKAITMANELLTPLAKEIKTPDPVRLDIILEAQALPAAVKALLNARWGYLSAITGLDWPATTENEEGHIEVLYHFCEGAIIATLRVMVPYSHAVVPTVCDQIPSCTLYERELIEMFGVVVENTPNTDRLLLPDDWPTGVYPLRKEFTGLNRSKTD